MPTLQQDNIQRLLQEAPAQLAQFTETLMCRLVPTVEDELLVSNTADPKPAAYEYSVKMPEP